MKLLALWLPAVTALTETDSKVTLEAKALIAQESLSTEKFEARADHIVSLVSIPVENNVYQSLYRAYVLEHYESGDTLVIDHVSRKHDRTVAWRREIDVASIAPISDSFSNLSFEESLGSAGILDLKLIQEDGSAPLSPGSIVIYPSKLTFKVTVGGKTFRCEISVDQTSTPSCQ